jgi:hypothetical protein
MPIPPMNPPGAGTFGILGGLLLPLSMVLAWRARPPGPVGALVKAGAIDPGVALKPKTAGIVRPGDLDRFVRAGIVRVLDDGRVWVDLAALRRSRMRLTAIVGLAAAAVLVGGWLLARTVGLA